MVQGFQAAGGGNFAGHNLHGLQMTSGLNLVGRNVLSESLQIAAGVNIAGNLEGTQISAATNIALGWNQKANIPHSGTQISIVNIAPGGIGDTDWLLNIAGHVQHRRLDFSTSPDGCRHSDRINQFC